MLPLSHPILRRRSVASGRRPRDAPGHVNRGSCAVVGGEAARRVAAARCGAGRTPPRLRRVRGFSSGSVAETHRVCKVPTHLVPRLSTQEGDHVDRRLLVAGAAIAATCATSLGAAGSAAGATGSAAGATRGAQTCDNCCRDHQGDHGQDPVAACGEDHGVRPGSDRVPERRAAQRDPRRAARGGCPRRRCDRKGHQGARRPRPQPEPGRPVRASRSPSRARPRRPRCRRAWSAAALGSCAASTG